MNTALNSQYNISSLLSEMASLRHEIKNLREDVAYYQEIVRLLKHKRFAAKSEIFPAGLRTLFDEAEVEAEADSESESDKKEEGNPDKPRPKRGKPVRKPLPAHLERECTVIDLPEDQKVCPRSGAALVKIGEEVTEQLAIEPIKAKVIKTVRPKYICKCPICSEAVPATPHSEPTSSAEASALAPAHKIAPLEPQAIPKSMASASLLAHIAVSKYADALPLYRLAGMLSRSGIDLTRATLASWMIQCGELVRPLINLAKDELLETKVIYADETRYQILKRAGKTATSKSYVWVFMRAEAEGPKVIIYEVGPSRSHTVPLEFLGGYSGYLHTDGFEAYEALAERAPGITLVGDWVHVRRKFDEAMKAHGKLPGVPKAKAGLELINQLFHLERDLVPDASSEECLAMRQQKSKPIIDQLKAWAEATITEVPPKSLTGKALNYMLSRWSKLILFLGDPILGLDTNCVENAIRPFAVGRKNWLFSDSMAGAESSAALYSLICMARAAELNPFTYLTSVFTDLPKAQTADDVAALLPWNWQKSQNA